MTFLRRVEMPVSWSGRVRTRAEVTVNLGTRDGVFWDEHGSFAVATDFACVVAPQTSVNWFETTAPVIAKETMVTVQMQAA